MTNDTPPSACLTDFDVTKFSDTDQNTLPGATRAAKRSLCLRNASALERSVGTHQSRGYLRIRDDDFPGTWAVLRISAVSFYLIHVLTGEMPFRNVWPSKLVDCVVDGLRPTKHSNASNIGFSDPLWNFVELCCDQDMRLRPSAEEVVKSLYAAIANRDVLTPSTASKPGPPGIDPDPPSNLSPGRSREELLAVVTSESNEFPSVDGRPRVS